MGATLGLLMAQTGLCDLLLYDIQEGMPQGKALDMAQACALWGVNISVAGTNSLQDTAGSAALVVTAGLARKPGMSREELLKANAQIVRDILQEAVPLSPRAFLIVVTNPVDAMTWLAWRLSNLPPQRVMGMGGVLDSARLRAFLSTELRLSPQDIECMVLGGHGEQMVPVKSLIRVKGVAVESFIPEDRLQEIMQRTRQGGAEIVSLLRTGSAFYAPAASVAQMLKAVLLDERRLLACSAYLQGQYGVEGLFAGVPALLGAHGVEEVLEVPLTKEELQAFRLSTERLRELIEQLKEVL